MFLNEVSFHKLKVGDKVISAIGTPGKILNVFHDTRYLVNDEDGDMVEIAWDNGKTSYFPHYCLDKIIFVGD